MNKKYGKGSSPRPYSNMKSFLDNWDEVFGRKKPRKEVKIDSDEKETTKTAQKLKAKKLSLCPHCANNTLKQINSWTVQCSTCGWNE